MFVMPLLSKIFLLAWSGVFFIFYFSCKNEKKQYYTRLAQKGLRINKWQTKSKEIWEQSFQMQEDLALKMCKFFSPLYIIVAIIGFCLHATVPYFWILEFIVFIVGIIYLVCENFKIAKRFGVSSVYDACKTVSSFTMHDDT